MGLLIRCFGAMHIYRVNIDMRVIEGDGLEEAAPSDDEKVTDSLKM